MSAFERFSVYPCRFGDILLRDLTSVSFRTASKKSIVIPGGDLSPRAIVNCCSDPVIDLSTKDLDSLFAGGAAVSMTYGYPVNTFNPPETAPTLLQFQRRVDGAAFAAGGANSHVVASGGKGFLYVTEITAQQDDEEGVKVALSYIVMSDDGLNPPFVFSTGSILTSTPNFDGIWYLGPVRIGVIGGSLTTMTGIQSVTIRSGIDFRAPRADGDIYPINGSINAINPEIRITSLDMTANSLLTSPWGKALTVNANLSVNIFFQKGVHGGGRVAQATPVHMLIVANAADQTMDSVTVQKLDDARTEIIIRPIGPLVTSPKIAIT